jgi:hypothetical protein
MQKKEKKRKRKEVEGAQVSQVAVLYFYYRTQHDTYNEREIYLILICLKEESQVA